MDFFHIKPSMPFLKNGTVKVDQILHPNSLELCLSRSIRIDYTLWEKSEKCPAKFWS